MGRNIFVHVPKTAGSSLLSVLSTLEEDVFVINHDIRKKLFKKRYHYLKERDFSAFDDPFIFAFVRNPWDRLVSAFFYLNAGGNGRKDEKDYIKYLKKYDGNFALFVEGALNKPNKKIFKQIHFKPQYEWLCDDNLTILPHFIGRFETLNEDVQKISLLRNLDIKELPKHNTSHHKDYRTYYTDSLKMIVAEAYKEDIELFNYCFE